LGLRQDNEILAELLVNQNCCLSKFGSNWLDFINLYLNKKICIAILKCNLLNRAQNLLTGISDQNLEFELWFSPCTTTKVWATPLLSHWAAFEFGFWDFHFMHSVHTLSRNKPANLLEYPSKDIPPPTLRPLNCLLCIGMP